MAVSPRRVERPDIPPPPPPPQSTVRRMVFPLFLGSWIAGCVWLYFKEPDTEFLTNVPQFLEDVKPARRANE